MASCRSSLFFAVSTCFNQILPFLLYFLLFGRVGAQDRRNEVTALLEFHNPVGTSSSTGYWNNWNGTDENACNWTGVICSTNFTVAELDLSGWALTYINLEPLSLLPDLRHLDLSSNAFGEAPFDVGTLIGLIRLDISNSGLNDNIPNGIGNCTRLQYLYLAQNRLKGEIPSFRELVKLEILNLADNLLTGPFPEDLLELTNLASIDLSGNMLNGTIPSLPKLTNLQDLRLDDNKFSNFEESWVPPPNLQNLLVSGNQLDGMIPPGITNLSNLQSLNMSRNQLTTVPFNFSQLFRTVSFVAILDLSQNQLAGDLLERILPANPASLGPTSLKANLSHNSLTGSIPIDGNQGQPYFSLDLSYNKLSGPIPYLFNNKFTTIISLQLQNNSLSGDIVDVLLAAQGFIPPNLQLQNNQFTGNMSRIASGTRIYDRLSDLEVVDVSNNNLQMSVTDTDCCPLLGTLVAFMENSSSLYEFRLAGNNFSGVSLPPYFNVNLTAPLRILDLSNTQLKGEISNATFNGTFFPTLQLLNLSNNHLAGHLPATLVNFPDLTSLDVSNNGLSGQLPEIQPWNTLYTPRFFIGNNGLCGDPLPPCAEYSRTLALWQLLITIGGAIIVAVGSCVIATWRWRVYNKRHQQDADLIKALMEKESATLMALRDLKKATNNFAKSAQIGEGGFGAVYLGELNDGTRVAIKRSKREGSEKDKEQFLNEVRILSQIRHRHLVKLLGCCMENKTALLVFEYISNGTLQEHLQGKLGGVSLSWEKRLNIAQQTADALNYLHVGATFPIYHRDVKSANILLNEDFQAKVADFGISRLAPFEVTHVSTAAVGTMGYIDPEYFTSYQLTDKSDVYSFGVVLLELISAKPAIDVHRGGDEASLINFAKPHIESGDLQELIDGTLLSTYNDPKGQGKKSILNVGQLAMKCLQMQPRLRPSMNEVWKELQSLKTELCSTSKASGTGNEHHSQDSLHDDTLYFSESFSKEDFSLVLTMGESGIEMIPSSHQRE